MRYFDQYQKPRQQLVNYLQLQGIHDQQVLKAFYQIPRHIFIEKTLHKDAYENRTLPIGYGQTISQPSFPHRK